MSVGLVIIIVSYDDLLVGAPLYSQFSPSVRTSLGRVYVYFVSELITIS